MGIKRKKGDCSICDKKDVYLGRVRPAECISCYQYKKNKIYQERAKERAKKETKKKKTIKRVSDKLKNNLEEYKLLRDEYLKNNPICEVKDCFKPTTNLHHKAGREGDLLCDTKYFMACCETCHPKRIHENPIWAEKNGYIVRLREVRKNKF